MFDQMFKLLGIMAIPWCDGEPMDHTRVDVDTDVEFEAVFAFSLSFDPDVVPDAAVLGAESGGVHCDVHLFSSEKSDDPVHHLPNVGDGELFHPSLDHTMSRHIWTAFFDSLAIFEVRLDAIVVWLNPTLRIHPIATVCGSCPFLPFLLSFQGSGMQ